MRFDNLYSTNILIMVNNYKGKIPKISEIIAKEIGVSHNYYTKEILSHNFKKFDEIFQ